MDWKAAWEFIWKGDSVAAWFLHLCVAFIVIKYVFYPVVGVVFGTQYPIVAVVSASMEHPGGFDPWWDANDEFYHRYNITKEEFKDYPFPNGFNKGDIMILTGHGSVEQGDVVVYYANGNYPIIHRVIDVRRENGDVLYTTKGDNNREPLQGLTRGGGMVNEYRVSQSDVYGTAAVKIPYLGYAKIWFVKLIQFVLAAT